MKSYGWADDCLYIDGEKTGYEIKNVGGYWYPALDGKIFMSGCLLQKEAMYIAHSAYMEDNQEKQLNLLAEVYDLPRHTNSAGGKSKA